MTEDDTRSEPNKEEVEVLLESAATVLKFEDFKKTARSIFNSAKKLIGATAGYVALLNKETGMNELLFLDAGGLPCTVDPNLPMPVRGLREQAYEGRKTVYENDFEKSSFRKFMPSGHAELENVLFAPLNIEGRTVGIIGLANKPGGFDDHDAVLASAFGDFTAMALANSRLFESLKGQNEFSENLIDSTTDGIIAYDKEMRHTIWNPQMERITGMPKEKMLGRRADEVFPFLEETGEAERIRASLRGERSVSEGQYTIPDTGKTGRFESRHSPIKDAKGDVVGGLVIVTDITEHKAVQERLAYLASYPELNKNPVFETDVRGKMRYANPASRAAFPDLEQEKIKHPVLAGLGEIAAELKKSGLNQHVREIEFAGKIYEEQISSLDDYSVFRFYTVDITDRKRTEDRLKRSQEISHLGSWELDLIINELTWSDEVYRIFGLEPQEFGATYEAFLERVHPDDRQAVDDAYTSSIREGRDTYEIEHRVVRAHTGEIRVVREKCQHFRDEGGNIIRSVGMVHDITDQEIIGSIVEHTDTQLAYLDTDFNIVKVNTAYAEGAGYPKQQLVDRNYFDFFPDSENKTMFEQVRDSGEAVEYRSKPLEYAGQPERGITYWDWALKPVKNEAGRVRGLVVSATDVTEQVRSEELSALNRIDKIIHSTLDLQQILTQVAEEAAKAVHCESVFIALRKDFRWEPAAAFGRPRNPLAENIPGNRSRVMELVASTKQPAIINDAEADDRIDPEVVKEHSIKSTMVFPLFVRDRVSGAIFFTNHSRTVAFSARQIDFSQKLAYSISLAIENAQLYQAEHEIAKTLQKSLMSLEIPGIKGLEIEYFYQSASAEAEVGGDFFDVFEMPGPKYGIVVGDVAGKGIAAAAETARVKHMLRDRALYGWPPAETLASVNDGLCRQDVSTFTALTYGIYDPEKAVIVISNSGNPYPYMVSEDRFLQITGIPMAIVPDGKYPTVEVKLNRGDMLFIYTDGLAETRRKGELFGEERVRSYIKSHKDLALEKLIAGTLNEVRKFSDNNLTDDIILFGLKKT
jgi:PAS domain S-box-containing protein